MKKKILMLSCLLTAASALLQASPVTYNLSFIGGPIVPTAGSFTYDASLAVNPFSAFLVTQGGVLFDLTIDANAFTGNTDVGPCKSGQSAAGFFNALTTAGCQSAWNHGNVGPFQMFQIIVCADAFVCDDGAATVIVTAGGPASSAGFVAATPASTVPEPGALWLSGAGIVALIARARRKRSGGVPAVDSLS
ncbi:MAG: PEP-CTERM sorting domain-containing protein [Acidobacteria bacterium]|nr:PEP-CTERM sorting domain-containing protein [Acidobacteriota bacterium]